MYKQEDFLDKEGDYIDVDNLANICNKLRGKIKRQFIMQIISYILIVLLAVLFYMFRCQCQFQPLPTEIEKGSIHVVQPNKDMQDDVNLAADAGLFNVFMNTDITFENTMSKGDVMIQNVDTNKYPMYVEIYADNILEPIYKSATIPVGYKVEQAKLSANLPKGTYDCTAYFYVLDTEDSTTILNRIGIKCSISILK